MARARYAGAFNEWPPDLDVCKPADWLEPGEDVADELSRRYSCWVRWCNARETHLRSLGMRPDDAMHDSVGDFPRTPVASVDRPSVSSPAGESSTSERHAQLP